MTIVLELKPEMERKLRERAAASGQEVAAYIGDVLERAIATADVNSEFTEAEKTEIRAGVQRGMADFEAGRFRTAEAFYAEMAAKHGLDYLQE